MTLYGGIDLHSNNVLISLINDHDELVSEARLPITFKPFNLISSPSKQMYLH